MMQDSNRGTEEQRNRGTEEQRNELIYNLRKLIESHGFRLFEDLPQVGTLLFRDFGDGAMYIDHIPPENGPHSKFSTLIIGTDYSTKFEYGYLISQKKIPLSDEEQQVETISLLRMALKAYKVLEAK